MRKESLLGRVINARYGLRGMRLGEASHPGPPVRRRRRVRSSSAQSGEDGQGFLSDVRRAAPSTSLDSTTQLPGQVDGAVSEDEPLIRPNIGRHVLPRMEPDQPSSDAEIVLSATVPASSRALRAARLTAMHSEHGSRVICPSTQVFEPSRCDVSEQVCSVG